MNPEIKTKAEGTLLGRFVTYLRGSTTNIASGAEKERLTFKAADSLFQTNIAGKAFQESEERTLYSKIFEKAIIVKDGAGNKVQVLVNKNSLKKRLKEGSLSNNLINNALNKGEIDFSQIKSIAKSINGNTLVSIE